MAPSPLIRDRRLPVASIAALAIVLTAWPRVEARTAADTTPAAVPAYRQANHVGVLRINGPIDRITLRSLERRIAEARRDGVDAIVLDIDTPGGELTATLDICNLLKDRRDTPPNTVAWVNEQAYSAGTIISLACREIVVAPNAAFGDAAPISPFGPIPLTERAKLESPILAEVIDSARRNHYDENLVQAFVAVGVELWLIENVETGDKVFVGGDEYERVFGEPAPRQQTPVAPAAAIASGGRIQPLLNDFLPEPQPGEGLTEEEARADIEFQQQLPPRRAPLTEDDRGKWRLIGQVVSEDRLLTVKPTEALFYGLAVEQVATEADLAAYFGASRITRYDRSWSESLVRLLVSWPVRIVLIIIFVIALFIELAAPGLGVFGATAGVALLVLIGAPYLAGLAQWWDIMLIAVGLLLVAAELLVIPGFGIAGVSGVLCVFAGLVGTFISSDLSSPQGQNEAWVGLTTTLTAMFAAGVGLWLVSRQIQSVPLLNRLVLNAEVDQPGARVAAGPGLLESMGRRRGALEVGDEGTAATDLRPAGRATFEGRMVDVKSVAPYIERGTPVRVVAVGRFVIEVEEVES